MTNNTDLLHNLSAGQEVRLMADIAALHAAKTGLMIAAFVLLAVGLYLGLCQMGLFSGIKKSVFLGVGAVLALGFSGLLYYKQQTLAAIDTNTALLIVSDKGLKLTDKNITLLWKQIQSIELKTSQLRTVKNTKPAASYDVRVTIVKPENNGEFWLNPAPKALSDMQKAGFITLNYEALGVDPALLASALEKYRMQVMITP